MLFRASIVLTNKPFCVQRGDEHRQVSLKRERGGGDGRACRISRGRAPQGAGRRRRLSVPTRPAQRVVRQHHIFGM